MSCEGSKLHPSFLLYHLCHCEHSDKGQCCLSNILKVVVTHRLAEKRLETPRNLGVESHLENHGIGILTCFTRETTKYELLLCIYKVICKKYFHRRTFQEYLMHKAKFTYFTETLFIAMYKLFILHVHYLRIFYM